VPNCIFFIAHARNAYISTSGQKSDVTIVFTNPDFLYNAEILAIRPKNGPNCIFFIAHAQNGLISTSCQKSDVTIVFPDFDFLQDGGILGIRVHLRQILRFSYLQGFSGPLGQKWRFLGVK